MSRLEGTAVDEKVMVWAQGLFDGFIRIRLCWSGARPVSEVTVTGLLVDARVVAKAVQYPGVTFLSPESHGARTRQVSQRGKKVELQEPPVYEPVLMWVDRSFRFKGGPERCSQYADLIVPTDETREDFLARVRRDKYRRVRDLLTAEEGVPRQTVKQLYARCEQSDRLTFAAIRLCRYLHAVMDPGEVKGYIEASLRQPDDAVLAELAGEDGWNANGTTRVRLHLAGALFLLETGWLPPY